MILGVDPGTATTGYGFIQEDRQGNLVAVDYGVFLTPPDLLMEQRLLLLYQQLKEKILFHRPQYGAVEKLFFARNVTTAISVGQARGVILLALAEAGVQVAEYTPNEIKQAVSGYGGADKKQMQIMVTTLLNLETIPKPDDAADALGVAICHHFSSRFKLLAEEQAL
jgi:crossover junction endodeoxyribonuclease RuvC